MITLARVENGRILNYYNGNINEVNYGNNQQGEKIVVPLPEWALEIRKENEKTQTASSILVWNYNTREFTIVIPEIDWQTARNAYIEQIRGVRNKLLHYTDWVETTDRLDPALKDEVMNYRQALRNFTSCDALASNEGFEAWCTSHYRQPLPLEFLPVQNDTVKSFYRGYEIVL